MKVLAVDDESDILEVIQGVFDIAFPDVDVITAYDGEEALARFRQEGADLVVTDLQMPRMDGEALVAALHKESPGTQIIVLSAYGSIEKAVSLIHAGARDFVTKPFRSDDLINRIRMALETVHLRSELDRAREALEAERKGGRILYSSSAMQNVLARLTLAAKSEAPVLVTGESGTGKELVARELHQLGPRKDRPFVPVNCSAFVESLLEAELFGYKKGAFTGAVRDYPGIIMEAHRGTLFLDEIAETSLSFQVKLLRFLQEGEIRSVGDGKTTQVDVRVVAATHQDLKKLITDGKFREDLYYRLHVVPIHLPPLRERQEDILLLANHFLQHYGKQAGRELNLSPQAAQRLMGWRWPGNIRELQNKMRQISILAPRNTIHPEDVELDPSGTGVPLAAPLRSFPPEQVSNTRSFQDAKQEVIDTFEREFLEALLKTHHGSPSKAAEAAGLDRKNLWRLLKKHDLSIDKFK